MNKKQIFFLGSSGFPYGLAEIQKIILISKALLLTGNQVTIICNQGVHNYNDHPEMTEIGSYQNIDYVYTSGTPFRNNSFLKRNLSKLKGFTNEFLWLKKSRKNKQRNYAILSTDSFMLIVYYSFLAKLFRFKTILNYVEFYSAIKKEKSNIGDSLNAKLFDRYAPSLTDGVFPISEFIINHLKKVAPNKKYLKIPGLTEFERYDEVETTETEKFFLYCGAASYKEVIQFTINSFLKLDDNGHFLYLVSNGSENEMADLKNFIANTAKKDKIKLFSKLSQHQLFTYYKNATALLIPLRPTWQDIARFPHKFGEYLASANPVITTNYGEVTYYFEDVKNMLIANKYDTDDFASKMQFVIDNSEIAAKIGIEGKKSAESIFDYRSKAADINNFFATI